MPFNKRAFKFVFIPFFSIVLLWGGCICFSVLTGRAYYYEYNHETSEYPNNIVFGPKNESGQHSSHPFMISPVEKSYERVVWVNATEGANIKCPLTLEADGKTWKPDDFEYDAFLKMGGDDDRVTWANSLLEKPPVDWSKPPSITYRSKVSDLMVHASYTKDKVLKTVSIGPSNWSPDLPKKEYRITIPQGTVTLPADHKEILKGLGQPVKHTPAFKKYYSGRVPYP